MSTTKAGPSQETSQEIQNSQSFDRWAQSYDTQCNPLLHLEQRLLAPLLPEIADQDVLDVGCGSGRWLGLLAQRKPRSLCGIDSSSGMLEIALRRHLPGVELVQASCQRTPFPDQSFNVVLASFLLSYIENLEEFAAEISRVARPGCDLFVTDMHPDAQTRLGWKRTFQDGDATVELSSFVHPIEKIVAAFRSRGWETNARLDPHFGDAEREIFATAGRASRFDEARQYPAIYILHLRKSRNHITSHRALGRAILSGARCAFEPQESKRADLEIAGGRITRVVTEPAFLPNSSSAELDLSGYLILPGLINAHDHLEFALFPRLAGSRYSNASEWADDIHLRFTDLIAEHRSVPKNVRLWWGAVRNLLAGVTTVCHHNPAEDELQRDDFPVRVVQDFGWSHSLAFEPNLRESRAAAYPSSPFILHACEGIDEQARNEIWELDRMGVLDGNCVLVHGLGLDRAGYELVRKRAATLVLCPSSNQFLFGTTPQERLFESEGRVALGSDSPLTAVGDLLDEARFAINVCRASAHSVYCMITRAPAEILRLSDGEGTIELFGTADLIAIRDTGDAPSARLRTLSVSDVELVMIRGRIHLASETIVNRLPAQVKDSLEPLYIDGVLRWLRAPIRELLATAERILGVGSVKLGGKSLSIPETKESANVR